MTSRERHSQILTAEEARAHNCQPVAHLEELYSHTAVSVRRLPLLQAVCDRFTRHLSKSIRQIGSEFFTISIDSIRSLPFAEAIEPFPIPALIGMFRNEVGGGHGLFSFDPGLIHLFVDLLLGGRIGRHLERDTERPFTPLERNLLERVFKIMVRELGSAFETDPATQFIFERLETNPRFAQIERPTSAVFDVHMRVEMEERSGTIELILPFNTVEPICSLLTPQVGVDQDPNWQMALTEHLYDATFTLDVILDQTDQKLVDVIQWKKGSKMFLLKSPASQVVVACEGQPMFRASIGHREQRLAISIEEVLP